MEEYAIILLPLFLVWTGKHREARDGGGPMAGTRDDENRGVAMKTRATLLGFVVVIGLSIALPPSLQAFSVGEIVIQSSRGMPFLAEIPLLLEAQERTRGVTATLGDAREYRTEGLTRAAIIDSLGVKVISGARDIISIASNKPIQEPVFDVLLLVRVGQVTIVKMYHIVLPAPPLPPALQAANSPSAAPSLAPPRNTPPKVPTAAWMQRLPERYGPIEPGATLYSVVEGLGVPKDLFWQMIVLLWRANKQDFSGGNLHGLRTGMFLTIPADLADNFATLNRTEAQRIIAEEWDNWQALRQAAGGQQRVALAREEAAGVTRKVATSNDKDLAASEKYPVLKEKSSTPPETLATASSKTLVAGADIAAVTKGKVVSSPAVVLSPRKAGRAAEATELRSVLQGIEELLARRLPQTEGVSEVTSFVSTAELQTALKGLEERLVLRLHESVAQAPVPQQQLQPLSSAPVAAQGSSVLEKWLPTNSMIYVLAVENVLLLLLAIGILWRWYRSRA
jgi:Tfp pilus assembly protein FimV